MTRRQKRPAAGRAASGSLRARRAKTVAAQERRAERVLAARRREEQLRQDAAKKAWKKLGDRQHELAAQVVETRRHELLRAYKGVVAVTSGYATQRTATPGKRQVRQESCVTFIVRRKRHERRGAPRQPGDVPEFLLTYADAPGGPTLYAVPTDVEDQSRFRLKIHHAQVIVNAPGCQDEIGVITCLVNRPGDAALYALSCRHVFGLAMSDPPEFPVGAEICVAIGTPASPTRQLPVIAKAVGIYGLLMNVKRVSFDVALAKIVENDPAVAAALVSAVRRIVPPTHAQSLDEIRTAGSYKIRTPDGDLPADFVRGWGVLDQDPVKYSKKLPVVYQSVLVVESHMTNGNSRPGHSGSPVVSADGRTLLGMHFAGGGEKSYMIPAYELFKTSHFIGMSSGQMLQLA